MSGIEPTYSPISVTLHCDLAVGSYILFASICDVSVDCFPGRTNHNKTYVDV